MVSITMASVMAFPGKDMVEDTVRLPTVEVLVKRPPLPLMVRPPVKVPPVKAR